MDATCSPRYALTAGKRRCRFPFQKKKPTKAQRRNSAVLMSDMAKLRGICDHPPS
jgi:hypothetical protein